jgi:hypothetical protein
VAFLRALERTGEARAAALDAGIDHSTAYARRRAHPDFADTWAAALAAHRDGKRRAEEAAIAELHAGRLPAAPNPPREHDDLVACRGQLRRAGHDRWSPRKERLFFAELAVSANLKRAAAAAGVSTNAIHARRSRDWLFREKWHAVRAAVGAAIDMNLFATAQRAFDPEALDVDIEPKISVADAIRILQLQRPADGTGPEVEAYDVEAVRQRLEKKMAVLFETEAARLAGEGWSYDEEHRTAVPPGWVRG